MDTPALGWLMRQHSVSWRRSAGAAVEVDRSARRRPTREEAVRASVCDNPWVCVECVRCRHCPSPVRWPGDLQLGDVEPPHPL